MAKIGRCTTITTATVTPAEKIRNREVFKDGSQLLELENGSLLLLEGKSSKALMFAEHCALQ